MKNYLYKYGQYFMLLVLTSTAMLSQSMDIQTIWEHRLDTNTFKSMIMTDDGGIVASITMPGGDLDYVLKLNSDGKKEWSFIPFNNKSFFIKSLQKADSGKIAVSAIESVGNLRHFRIGWGYSVLLNNDGEVVWEKPRDTKDIVSQYHSPYIRTKNNEFVNFFIPALVTDDPYRFYFRRMNKDGIKGDDKLFDSVEKGEAMLVVPKLFETKDNGFLTMYYTTENLSRPDSWHLTKLDAKGNVIFKREWSELPGNEPSLDILELSDGSFLVLTSSRENLGSKGVGFLRKFSADGTLLAKKTFTGSELLWLKSLALLPNGNIIAAGQTTTYKEYEEAIDQTLLYSYPAFDGFVAVFNQNLDLQWQTTFGKKGIGEIITTIIPITNEEFYIGGFLNNERAIARVKFTPSITSVQEDVSIGNSISSHIPLYYSGGKVSAEHAHYIGIYDILGRLVAERSGTEGELTIATDTFSSGIYYVHAKDIHGNNSTLPIIIQ